jgi:hypothetical protein
LSVARDKDHMLKVFAKSPVFRRTPGPQRKGLTEISSTMQMQVLFVMPGPLADMEISSTMQMQVLYVTPGRLANETGGTRYKLPGPGPVCCVCFVFLGSVIYWLYTLTLSDQAHVTAAES